MPQLDVAPLDLALFGALGYGVSALLFTLLGIVLLTGWRGRMQGGLLVTAVLTTACWAAISAIQAQWRVIDIEWIWAIEALRNLAWMLFLIRLLEVLGDAGARQWLLARARIGVIAITVLLCLPLEGMLAALAPWLATSATSLRLVLDVLLAVAGLVLVEQVFRNTPWQHRWGIKYLCLGVGGLFAFDFYFFADALLFHVLDPAIWSARGATSALAAPLIGISAARNPQWSFDLFVSRKVVFHSTALLGAGIYLLIMSLAGYFIRYLGGEWSSAVQILFFFGAGLVLAVMLFSGQLRSRLKLFVNKHFFHYRYDYREEWLHLTRVLSGKVLDAPLAERVIYALAELVESPGGLLWLREEGGRFALNRAWNLPEDRLSKDLDLSALGQFLAERGWVVDLAALRSESDAYEAPELPDEILSDDDFWLIAPLMHDDDLIGFVILLRARTSHVVNWEVMDILKTAARQAASYLVLDEAARLLADARQFEGFNRLSAFVVHDLKNLIAQLSLVAKNGKRHRANPAFVDDAMATIENSVAKMNRLLAQLRSTQGHETGTAMDLVEVARSVVKDRSVGTPVPTLEVCADGPLMLRANPDRLTSIVSHVVQNAQEATPGDGRVIVHVGRLGEQGRIDVRDTGCGMDAEFLRERLFKPFDSTKGLTGMGVGAYEARELVRSLGGWVTVDSTPGRGTLFRMVFPIETTPIDVTTEAGAGHQPAPDRCRD